MPDRIDVGETVTLRFDWFDASGTPAAPTSVVLTITKPNGTTIAKALADLTAVVGATGRYTYAQVADVAGVWSYGAVASGGGVSSDTTDYFLVGGPAAGSAGPCDDWIGPYDVFTLQPAAGIAVATRDLAVAAWAAEAASLLLYKLQPPPRYTGICRETVRPCRRSSCWAPPGWWAWDVSWGACACGAASPRACGCGGLSELALPGSPVLGIASVKVDGVTLVSGTDYRVDDDRYLVRLGDEVWPSCQDLTADPASDVDTFEVTYFYGRPVGADGQLAAKRLAGELYLAATGGECSLPAMLQNLARRGIDVEAIQPDTLLEDGGTGLYEVDLFLNTERRARANLGTLVVSPDAHASVRRVGTA